MGIRVVLISILLLCSTWSMAQVKTVYEGQSCYEYIVEKGNTLYGISKEFAVPITAIIGLNPEVEQGLSIGQKVYIPMASINRKEAKKSPDLVGNDLIHSVRKGETLYSLSKKYKVAINDLVDSNPGVSVSGLRKGQVIRIPTSEIDAPSEYVQAALPDSLSTHEVLAGETLYSLSKQYGVSIESITSKNDGLPDGLKVGMQLFIPKKLSSDTPLSEDSLSISTQEPLIASPQRHLDVALLLPFSLKGGDTTRSVIPRNGNDIMRLTDIAYEFYRGAQMCLDDLSAQGLDADVIVLDITNDSKQVDRVLANRDLSNMDIIIGPLHKESFERICESESLSGVFKASPLSGKLKSISGKPEQIAKIKPSDAATVEFIVRHIKSIPESPNVVLLKGAERSRHAEFARAWKTLPLEEDSLAPAPRSYKEIPWDNKAQSKLLAALDPYGPNIIVFPIEDRPAATDLMSKLATSEFMKMDILLFGMESWVNYDNLDATVLEQLHLHIPATRHVDWQEEKTVDFIQDFKSSYGTIPSPNAYAMLAYDLVDYYVGGMMEYGAEFLAHQDELASEGMSVGFDMRKRADGVWDNQFVYLLEFKDFDFHRVK